MANTLKLGNGKWATGKDTVLSFSDTNNNFKPLPFDFSRASSATVVNQSGLIETVQSGTPRIDFLGNTKGALKLEPTRTNRMPNSEDGSTWVLSNITLSSLSGGLNKEYYQITSLGNTGRFDVVQNNWVNLTAGTYTASVFAKKGTSDQIILTTRANFSSQSAYSVFNLTSGTVVSNNGVTGSIEPYSDGWYRCAITFTNSGSYTDFASFAFGFNFNSSSTDTLFVASPQSEIGSYPTSYIPTSGSAVTRVGEKCEQNLSNVVSLTEGVIYIDTTNLGNDGANSNIISQSSVVDTVFCLKVGSNNKILIGLFASSVNIPITSTSAFPLGTRTKIAFHYKSGNSKLYINGSLEGTNAASFTLGSGFATALRLIDTSLAYNAYPSKSIAKEFKVYNTGLTSAELQALTTI